MTSRHSLGPRLVPALYCALLCLTAPAARAQFFPNEPAVPGVWVEQDGNVRSRQVDPDNELAAIRERARSASQAAKNEKLTYVSLPRLFADARAAIQAGKPVPENLRLLGGLTRLRYVLVY